MEARRVLIFDVNNEYGEFGIKTIPHELVPVFMQHPKIEMRRVIPFKPNGKGGLIKQSTAEMLTSLETIVNTYMGGALVVEDPSKFFSKSVSEDLIGAICTNRHASVDMILHYQSVGRILPVLHENINIYRFHRQGDDVLRSKNKLEDLTEMFKIAQIMVDAQFYGRGVPKNIRYFVYLDKDAGKIKGMYTREQVNAALEEYLRRYATELKYWENERNDNGSKRYTYLEAKQAYKNHLIDLYFNDNSPPADDREPKMMVAIGFKGVGKTWETVRMLREEYCPTASTQNPNTHNNLAK